MFTTDTMTPPTRPTMDNDEEEIIDWIIAQADSAGDDE